MSNWQPINLAAPEFDQPTEPPALYGLIYAEKRHALSGPPEAVKTSARLRGRSPFIRSLDRRGQR